MEAAVSDHQVFIRHGLDPYVACHALFVDAIVRSDERLVQNAIRTLKKMYLEELISPLEAAYIFCKMIPAEYPPDKIRPIPVDANKKITYEAFVLHVIYKSFGGVPLAGSKAELFFRACRPLNILTAPPIPDFIVSDKIQNFLFEVIWANDVTLDLFEAALKRLIHPPSEVNWPLFADRSLIGHSIISDHKIPALAKSNPGRFVKIAEAFFRPLMERILEAKLFLPQFLRDVYKGGYRMTMEVLATALQSLVESGAVPDSHKETFGRIALLMPYFENAQLFITSKTLKSMRRLFKKSVEERWFHPDDLKRMGEAYGEALDAELKSFCTIDFSRFNNTHYGYKESRMRMAGLLAALAALEPQKTGEAVVRIARKIALYEGAYFGEVSPVTARRRIHELLHTMADEFPESLAALTQWVHLDGAIEKTVLQILSKKVHVVV